ncbi:MAG: RecX family transcriptional regulator [Patescibacteria group bacterium]|nr:RecX family transcriptional regulator [Patescibacteria group bacterium]
MKRKNLTPSDNFAINLNRALRFLSFRPRSEKEVMDYLKKKQVDELNSQKIIDKLKEHKFLNDEEFAKWWIEQRTLIKPRAWRIIKLELRAKGIDDDVIQNSEFKIQNDLETAVKLAQKRLPRYKNLPKLEIYQKLGRCLVSKGFDWETVKKSIDEVFSKEYN